MEDYHSPTASETTQVGYGSEVCIQARFFFPWKDLKLKMQSHWAVDAPFSAVHSLTCFFNTTAGYVRDFAPSATQLLLKLTSTTCAWKEGDVLFQAFVVLGSGLHCRQQVAFIGP